MVVAQHLAGEIKAAVLAVEPVIQPHSMLVERAGHRHDLEGRARLEHVGDHPVSAVGRVGVPGLVGGVCRPVGQRENGAGPRVHHHDAGARRSVLRTKRLERLLGDVLDVGVERQHHVHPVARLHIVLAKRHHLATTAVGLGLAPAAHALKFRIKHHLNAVFPLESDHRHARAFWIPHTDKPHHMGSEIAAGINPQL